MKKCISINNCPFFNNKMAKMPAMASLYKQQYCEGDSAKCARYMVLDVLGKVKIPSDLYPNQVERVKKILNIHVKNNVY